MPSNASSVPRAAPLQPRTPLAAPDGRVAYRLRKSRRNGTTTSSSRRCSSWREFRSSLAARERRRELFAGYILANMARMRTVKISEAKDQLSRHLAYVRRGGRVRIMDRDVPVADLVPVAANEDTTTDDAMLSELERRGVLRRGSKSRLPADLLRPGPALHSGSVVETLLRDRKSSR